MDYSKKANNGSSNSLKVAIENLKKILNESLEKANQATGYDKEKQLSRCNGIMATISALEERLVEEKEPEKKPQKPKNSPSEYESYEYDAEEEYPKI